MNAERLAAALVDARRVELDLLASVSDERMFGVPGHFLEPPIWEMGHVGWFQEYWILRHLDGAATLRPGSDRIYDAFNVSYRQRWEHLFPSRAETLAYITEVLQRTLARLERREPTARDVYFYTLAALHEDMHAENLTLVLHSLGYDRPTVSLTDDTIGAPPVDEDYRPRDVTVPGGTFMLGAAQDEPFVFDNEKWAHPVEIAPFRISSTAVTNAEFLLFVEDGGYRRRECWSRRGWDWRRRQRAEHPVFWERGNEHQWCERRFDTTFPLAPWHPVVCVNWYEAEAYCRWARRRLPTEAEWEMAATAEATRDGTGLTDRKRRFPWGNDAPASDCANLDYRAGWTVDVRAFAAADSAFGCRQMIGNVWEWVADTFAPYPGFVADPYKEYSKPYFGQKKVLRGGCWTTRARLIRGTWRNFYKAHRRNIFAGFRTCAV